MEEEDREGEKEGERRPEEGRLSSQVLLPSTLKLTARLPAPAGGPRPAVCGGRVGKGGSGRRDPLEGPLLSFRQKKPQIPDPLDWGSESLRAG